MALRPGQSLDYMLCEDADISDLALSFPAKGDYVRFLGTGGWPDQLAQAKERLYIGQVLLVEGCNIDRSISYVKFVDLPGSYNTVMFERVKVKPHKKACR